MKNIKTKCILLILIVIDIKKIINKNYLYIYKKKGKQIIDIKR